ncbi:MAG TPA: enoyl-CoA hydratase/isomerase family protein [Candidatus Acidoferrum sp.]|nr:enoyl-CoA hydratase/isomerase family protein [Candidatus Acidoferrum sp.]
MPTPEFTTMQCKVEGPLAYITLNRPEVLNAMNLAWPKDLLAICATLAKDQRVKVVVISGAGRAFCSGIDLKALSGSGIPLEWFRETELAFRAVEELDKFVICAMHKYCIGGGLQLSLVCDLRIATDTTQFALTAVKECLIPGMGTFRLARYIGLGRARRIALTGEYFSAQDAFAMGLVDYFVPEPEFEAKVKEVTQNCLKIASEGQRQTKHLLGMAFDVNWNEFLKEYMASQERTLASDEHREAMAAYREKREPKFSR